MAYQICSWFVVAKGSVQKVYMGTLLVARQARAELYQAQLSSSWPSTI